MSTRHHRLLSLNVDLYASCYSAPLLPQSGPLRCLTRGRLRDTRCTMHVVLAKAIKQHSLNNWRMRIFLAAPKLVATLSVHSHTHCVFSCPRSAIALRGRILVHQGPPIWCCPCIHPPTTLARAKQGETRLGRCGDNLGQDWAQIVSG